MEPSKNVLCEITSMPSDYWQKFLWDKTVFTKSFWWNNQIWIIGLAKQRKTHDFVSPTLKNLKEKKWFLRFEKRTSKNVLCEITFMPSDYWQKFLWDKTVFTKSFWWNNQIWIIGLAKQRTTHDFVLPILKNLKEKKWFLPFEKSKRFWNPKKTFCAI